MRTSRLLRCTGDSRAADEEVEQADPMLALSTGKLGAGAITPAALGIIAILAVVFYGMTR